MIKMKKKRMKYLATLVAAIFILTMVPMLSLGGVIHPEECVDHDTNVCQIDESGGVLYYDANGDPAGEGDFVVSTSKTIAETNTENEFDITLKVETTEKIDENVLSPDVAVVLVMDISSSMKWTPAGNTANNQPDGDGNLWGNDNLAQSKNYEFYKDGTSRMAQAKVAARAFLDEYVANADGAQRMISIVSFGSSATVVQSWIDLSAGTNMAIAQKAIDDLIVTGDIKGQNGTQWTFLQGGLMIANNLINASDISSLDNRFVITVTDGNPTYYSAATTVTGTSITGTAVEPNGQPESANNVRRSREGAAPFAKAIQDSGVELYTIGFAIPSTNFAVSTTDPTQMDAEKWLKDYIASPGCALTAGTGLDLIKKLGEINEIIRSWTDAWIVSDPMGTNIIWDETNNLTDRTFVDNVLRWNLRTSDPKDFYVRADGKTVYVYEYTYAVSLDTLSETFAEGVRYDTNEPTSVSYRTVTRTDNNRPSFGEWATAGFTIPAVHGYAADLSFFKVGNDVDQLLAGAEFLLWIGDKDDPDFSKDATSGDNGLVSFADIPSGHVYKFMETVAPDNCTLDETEYTITVSYGELAISPVPDVEGMFVTKSEDGTLYFKNESMERLGKLTIQKMVEDKDSDTGYSDMGGFVFKVYGDTIGDKPDPNTYIGEMEESFLAGLYTITSDKMEPGLPYYIFEEMNSEQAAIYMFGAQGPYLAVQALKETDPMPSSPEVFYNDLIPSNGTLVIEKGLGKKASYGSVTGGYSAEGVINDHTKQPSNLDVRLGGTGSWFQYNGALTGASDGAMDFTQQASYTFDLVTGNNLKKVGEYTIAYADGAFTVTVNPKDNLEIVGVPHLSISSTIETNVKNANGQKTKGSIWTSSPGQQTFPFGGYQWAGNTITVPATKTDVMSSNGKKVDYTIPAIDPAKVYAYIHLGLEGYEDTYGQPDGSLFKVLVTGPSYPDGETFDVPMNGSVKLENLKPGVYTVEETEKGWTATYYVAGNEPQVGGSVNVTVNNDKVTTVKLTNEPGEGDFYGMLAIQKMVEDKDSDTGYSAMGGFVFKVYGGLIGDEPDLDTYIGEMEELFTAGSYTILSDKLIQGETYYVFEEMTDEQAAIYMFGSQGPYLEIKAYSKEDPVIETPEFYNDLALGSLEVTANVTEEYYEIEYEPIYGIESGGDDTLVSWLGNGNALGSAFGNKHTYVIVDVNAASTNDGIWFTIADSSPDNRPIDYMYNVKIADDMLTISFNDKLVSASVGAYVVNDPSQFPGNAPSHSASTVTVGMPDGYNDIVYLYFHLEKGIKWYGDEIVGWKEISRTGPLTRDYTGELTLIVTNEDGEDAYNGTIDINGIVTIPDLKPGEYTCVLSGSYGFDPKTETVTVEAGEKATLTFTVVAKGDDVEIKIPPVAATAMMTLAPIVVPTTSFFFDMASILPKADEIVVDVVDAADEDVIDEDVADEDVIDEDVIDEDVADEDVADEDVAIEDVVNVGDVDIDAGDVADNVE